MAATIQHLTLPDNRTLDYFLCGTTTPNPTTTTMIWIHGTPGAYNPTPALERACAARNTTLVTFSRAGYGGSSRNVGRSIASEVDDVAALLKHLGVTECVVGGWSGGGAPALACAALLEGCKAAVCVAGTAPYGSERLEWLEGMGQDNLDEYGAALKGETALRAFVEPHRAELLETDVQGLIGALETLLPPVDKKFLQESDEMGRTMVSTFHEAVKNGVDGWVDDDMAMLRPWGFEAKDVKVPLFLYHGSEDKMVPFAHGQWLAKHIPDKYLTAHLEQGEGHISIFMGRVEGVLDELLAAVKKS